MMELDDLDVPGWVGCVHATVKHSRNGISELRSHL